MENQEALINIIKEIQKLIKIIKEKTEKKFQTILLIGDTGSGKSTIFNWFIGGKFQIAKNKKNTFELQLIKEQGDHFAVQGSATQSVTYLPNFYFLEEYNHLIVDFPGFKDTHGTSKQLTIKLMFNEIIATSDVKLVLVTHNPNPEPPDRGTLLLKNISENLVSQGHQISSIGYILNNYSNEDITEEEEIKPIMQEQIAEMIQNQSQSNIVECLKALSKNIIILKYISKANIQTELSDQKRKEIISKLIQIKPNKLILTNLDQNNFISEYIKAHSVIMVKQFVNNIEINTQNNNDQKYEKNFNYAGQQDLLIKDLSQFIQLLLKNQDKQKNLKVSQYVKEMIVEILKFKFFDFQDKTEQEKATNFVMIIDHFFKYQSQIKGFSQLELQLENLKSYCERIIDEIKSKLQDFIQKQNELKRIEEESKARLQKFIEEEDRKYQQQVEREERKIKRLKEQQEKKELEREKQKQKQEKEEREERERQKKIAQMEKAKQIEQEKRDKIEKEAKVAKEKQEYEQVQEQLKKKKQNLQLTIQSTKSQLYVEIENLNTLKDSKKQYVDEQSTWSAAIMTGDFRSTYVKKVDDYNEKIKKSESKIQNLNNRLKELQQNT